MARAMGTHVVRVEDPGELPNAIRDAAGVDASAFYSHIQGMNKLLSAALTTTATAYGGSPAGCAR